MWVQNGVFTELATKVQIGNHLIDGLTNYYASALICIPENKVFVGPLGRWRMYWSRFSNKCKNRDKSIA